MPAAVNIDGVRMFVSSTGKGGVVDVNTRIAFSQRGSRVVGRYQGGRVRRCVLVGAVSGAVLTFRYLQVEVSGDVHGGRSTCDIARTAGGRLRIIERFAWTTREGRGTNVFDEVPA